MNGGPGEHGTPALKDVMGACRPQPGLFLRKPRMEGVPVLGSSQGPNTAMNYPVLQKKVSMIFIYLIFDLVKFVPAVAYYFCLNLPAIFSQPRTKKFSQVCIAH